ncbi:MAG: chemotaxis protein CheB [Elainellaceae cyanobacterium]
MASPSPSQEDFFIVGIGASAGGVQALESFFSSLPDNPNAAFVVVQHLSPNHRSMMAEILQRKTTLPVQDAQDHMLLEPAKVYVLPPRKSLIVKDRRLCLEDTPKSPHYPINLFFRSLVKGWGDRTIAILLSGTGNDGTEGLQAVSRVGGIALVQSPETAQFTSMPTSAIPSGLVDEVLSPEDLAKTVYELVRFSENFPELKVEDINLIDPDQLQKILNILAEHEEIDFSHYKVSTLSRRIHHRCALTRNPSIDAYIKFIEESRDEQKLLRQDLLIGATCFFRDSGAWDILQAEVIPRHIQALEPGEQLRIWITACATGEEAYSMAIAVDEVIRQLDKPIQVKIFATDLDINALETAAQGIYPESIANDVSPERLEHYFDEKDEHYQVKRSLREMLIIAPHDLTKNAGFSRMNLVSCRNVLIYMQPRLQQQVLRLLHFALAAQGTLVLGSSETLGGIEDEFIVTSSRWKIFQKRRNNRLSLVPLTRQEIVTPLKPSVRKKSQQQFDLLLSEVFRLCFSDRQITCLLINDENQLLRVFYNGANLLEYPIGETNLEVSKIVPPALRLPLSTALHRAKRDRETVLYTDIKLEREGKAFSVTMRVGPDNSKAASSSRTIVILEIEAYASVPLSALHFDVGEEAAQQVAELEYELQQTRENLQVTIEELETANEEQQATNEELLASNEELQSTNEELQSVNEELYTVNGEYQSKIQELTQLNNDIDNLLRSTDIGVIFLDAELQIRRYTPAATRTVNIKPTDVGRPLSDLTNSLDYPDLVDILKRVNDTQEPYEQEVKLEESDRYVLMRIRPYSRDDRGSDGTVITFVNIDDLKQIQVELQQTNEILENLYAISPVGLCLQDEHLQFLRINPALAETNGASIDQHIGRTLSEIAPDLAAQVEPLLRQVIKTGEPIYGVEIWSTTPASPDVERYWTASYYPVDFLMDGLGVGSVVVDITERVRAEKALRASQAKLLNAQQLAKVGSWDLELQGDLDLSTTCPQWSDELLRIYELEGKETPLSFTDLIQLHVPEDQGAFENALTLLITEGIPFSLDVQFNRSDGELCCLSAIGQAIRDREGQTTKLYGTVMDVSERKQIENELTRKNVVLEEAIAVAQAADSENQAKSEFLANMSHEIRTPINSILMSGQLLQRMLVQPRQRQVLTSLMSSGEQLLAIIDDILNLSQLEARQLRLEERLFKISSVFKSLSNIFGSLARAQGLTLAFEADSDIPEELIGDDFRLQQILSNLISNALKFTPSGVITVSAALSTARSSAELSVPLRFTVRDTGIGINPGQQDQLFQPFTQADASITRQFGGTGLGLTICRRIVQVMGGDIGVESAPEQGSTFWFVVPFGVTGPYSPYLTSQEPPAATVSVPQLRILLVEDNVDNRDLMILLLEELGYIVDWTGNGQTCLQKLAEQDYDIVLMDCQMPIMDGYEATRQLRQLEGDQKHALVIGLTAHAMEGDREKCLEAGMDGYLSKPIMDDDLAKIYQIWSDLSGTASNT